MDKRGIFLSLYAVKSGLGGTDGATPPRLRAFPTTQWSVVLNAGSTDELAACAALERLCQQYWYPIYSFVRRQGRAHHEAEDCTQEFFRRLLASGAVAKAQPARGKFRTYLLAAVQNFLRDEWHRGRAQKRGGGEEAVPLDLSSAENRFNNEPIDPALTPEHAFDRSWAAEVIARAIGELRAEYESTGRGPLFAALAPRIWGDSPDLLHNSSAAERPTPKTHAITMALHRLRRRLGERLRVHVAATLPEGADVNEELRQLMGTLGGDRGI